MSTLTAQKTVLNVKVDANLKKSAQEVARAMGLPISTVVSNLLKQFIANRSITFEESYMPNARTAKIINEAREDHKAGRLQTFNSMEDFIADLQN